MRKAKFLLLERPAYYELLGSTAAFMFSLEMGLVELVQGGQKGEGEENE